MLIIKANDREEIERSPSIAYTNDWVDITEHSIPPHTKVQICGSDPHDYFKVTILDIDADEFIEGNFNHYDEDDDMEYEAECELTYIYTHKFWIPKEYIYEKKSELVKDYTSTKYFLLNSIPHRKTKKSPKILRIHKLSKLLKKKTRGFLSKVSSFFKPKKGIRVGKVLWKSFKTKDKPFKLTIYDNHKKKARIKYTNLPF